MIPAELSRNAFEPRLGTAQLIFGVIYTLVAAGCAVITLRAGALAGTTPPIPAFFTVLFAALAGKSWWLWWRSRRLLAAATATTAALTAVTYAHGITTLSGTLAGSPAAGLPFASRFVGERLGRELERQLHSRGELTLPALVVDAGGRRPRAMFNLPARGSRAPS